MPGEGKQGRAETGAARRRIAPASHPFFLNRWRNSPARGGKPLPKFRFGSAPDCAARFAGRVAVTHSGLRVGVRVSGGVRSIRGAGFPRERNALPAGQAIGNALWVGAPRRVVRMARGCHSRRRLAGRPQRQENPEPGNGSLEGIHRPREQDDRQYLNLAGVCLAAPEGSGPRGDRSR
jgi:hypothetical protein